MPSAPAGSAGAALARAFFAHFAQPTGLPEQRAVIAAVGPARGTEQRGALTLRLGVLPWPQTLLLVACASHLGYEMRVRNAKQVVFP